MIREDQADIRVSVMGKLVGNAQGLSWATYDGGNLTATDAKTRSGGMGPEVSAGGPASRGDLTCTIQFDDVMGGNHSMLESHVGSGTATVSITYLTPQGVSNGHRFTRTGTLKSAELPKSDANGSAVTFYQITVSLDENAS